MTGMADRENSCLCTRRGRPFSHLNDATQKLRPFHRNRHEQSHAVRFAGLCRQRRIHRRSLRALPDPADLGVRGMAAALFDVQGRRTRPCVRRSRTRFVGFSTTSEQDCTHRPERGKAESQATVAKQIAVMRLIQAHRGLGHFRARVDPIRLRAQPNIPDLDPSFHGLTEADMDTVFHTGNLGGRSEMALREIVEMLRETYTGSIGTEFLHISEVEEKRWLQTRLEATRRQADLRAPTNASNFCRASSPPRASSTTCTPPTPGRSASRSKAARPPSPRSTPSSQRGRPRHRRRWSSAWPTAGA